MALDAGTLVAVLGVVCVLIASLLAFTWNQSRGVPILGTFAGCFALCAVAAGLAGAQGTIPEFFAVDAANAVRLLAFGLGWHAVCRLNGWTTNWALVLAPAALWLLGGLFSVFGDGYRLRILLSTSLVAAYSFAVAGALWHAASPTQRVARSVAALFFFHSLFLLARLFTALVVPEERLLDTIAYPLNPISLLETIAIAIALAFLLISAAKEKLLLQYRHAALIDPLTGVSNRRGFDAEVRRMLARSERSGASIALLLLDIDHFKSVNDNWGHLAGDRALQAFTRCVAAELRGGDLLARLGGEEFAVALADCRIDQALELAERIRQTVAKLVVHEGDAPIRLTVSIGVTSLRGAASPGALLEEADVALYRAKAAGRDRVNLAPANLAVIDTARTADAAA